MAAVQAEMDAGTDPADPKRKPWPRSGWRRKEFTGGDPGIAASLKKMYESEPKVAGMDTGPMQAQRDYITKALEAGKSG